MVDMFALARLALPPAPATPRLRTLRKLSAGFCLGAALAVAFVTPLTALSPWLVLLCPIFILSAVATTLMLFRDQKRWDDEYWTEERRAKFYFDAGERERAKEAAGRAHGRNSLFRKKEPGQ